MPKTKLRENRVSKSTLRKVAMIVAGRGKPRKPKWVSIGGRVYRAEEVM